MMVDLGPVKRVDNMWTTLAGFRCACALLQCAQMVCPSCSPALRVGGIMACGVLE